jgi:hypothetical protein
MNKEQVRALALQHGFTLRETIDCPMDLRPYVYEFAQALLEAARESQPLGYITPGDLEDYKYYGLEGPVIGPKDETRTVPVYLNAALALTKEEQHG